MHYGEASEGPEAVQDLAAGVDKGGPAVEGDKERANPGDAHVPGQLGHVPHPGQLHRGMPAAPAETGLEIFRVRKFRLRDINLEL